MAQKAPPMEFCSLAISVFSEHHLDATHAPRHARRVKSTAGRPKRQTSQGNAEAVVCGRRGRGRREQGTSTPPRFLRSPGTRTRAAPTRAGEGRGPPRVRARTKLKFPCFQGRAHRDRGQPRRPPTPPPRKQASPSKPRGHPSTVGAPRARRTSTTQEPWPCRPMAPCSRRLPATNQLAPEIKTGRRLRRRGPHGVAGPREPGRHRRQ